MLCHVQVGVLPLKERYISFNSPMSTFWFGRRLYTSIKMSSKFYTLAPKDNKGEPYSFSQLEGKVVLIVNVASKCGFTVQYDELERLYSKFSERGFIILGFPCNQFGNQEPGSDEQIAQFCKTKYGVSFPIMKKIDVNGNNVDPVYEYLKSEKSGLLGLSRIKWNFEKFLINKHGKVVHRYSSMTKPHSLEAEIEKLLDEK